MNTQQKPTSLGPGSPKVCMDRVDWFRVAPVLRLLGTPKMALRPSQLAVAFLTVLAIVVWTALCEWFAWGVLGEARFFDFLATCLQAMLHAGTQVVFFDVSGVLTQLGRLLDLFREQWFVRPDGWSGFVFFAFWGLGVAACKVVGVTMLSVLAGDMACQQAKSQGVASPTLNLKQAFQATVRLAPRLVGAVAMLWVLIGVLLLPALVAAWLTHVPGLGSVAVILLVVWALLAACAAGLCVVYGFAIQLMPMALAIDHDDAFDCLSRSVNYSVMRPLRFVGCEAVGLWVVALVAWVVGGLLQRGLDTVLLVFSSFGDLRQGKPYVFGELESDVNIQALLADSAGFVEWCVWLLVAVFALSAYSSVQAWVYLILRRQADGAHCDEHASNRTLVAAKSAGVTGSDQAGGEDTATGQGDEASTSSTKDTSSGGA